MTPKEYKSEIKLPTQTFSWAVVCDGAKHLLIELSEERVVELDTHSCGSIEDKVSSSEIVKCGDVWVLLGAVDGGHVEIALGASREELTMWRDIHVAK